MLRLHEADLRPVGRRRQRERAQGGRGLTLIDALCDRWGTIPRHPDSKTVWAELDLAATAPAAP
ncbi:MULTISPECIES: hypothetical protein [unclassified Kitasatospora]